MTDAHIAAEAGADMLGFIFYPPSARYVMPETVRDIVFQVEANPKPAFAGVFVNTPAEEIREILDFCGLDFAQLHGDETPEMVASFGGRAFKAISLSSLETAETIAEKLVAHAPLRGRVEEGMKNSPFILLDAFHPTERGGTGTTADWGIAAQLAQRYPILLAGGLTPQNVADAIAAVRPLGVDVSSGVEASKGKKDPTKVRAFIEQARKIG